MTYNAALAPGFEPDVTERAPLVIQSLAAAATDLDVLCVQEFWIDELFAALAASVPELPHSVRLPPRPGTGDCSPLEFSALAGCLGANCSMASGEALVGCALESCSESVAALSGGCLGCIMNELDDVSACVGTGSGPMDPAIYGGSFDTGLLSRWPIKRSSSRELTSYFVRASVQYARLEVPNIGFVDTFCTHLGSPLGIVAYGGDQGSWELEQRKQIEELLSFVAEKNHGNHPVLILGDFNTGPATAATTAVWPENYELIRSAGFDDVYATRAGAQCTFCPDDGGAGKGELIDHVFSAKISTHGAVTERLFTESIPLSTGPSRLSDHFGVKVTFKNVR
jgi:endonuclease/exonuclease/phosphatase family metal-dependent hydrolase